MALSTKFYRAVKTFILALLAMSLLNLGIFLYYGVITIPYLSPVAVTVGDSLSPFTPLFDPTILYVNLKQWLHPATNAYRLTLKRRPYIAGLICQSIASFALVYCIALKFSWVVEKVYGLKAGEGMCAGPCWKLWTELVLLAIVVLAVAMGWELDGGLYWRFMDRQVEKLKQKDVERAAEERLATDGYLEKAAEERLATDGYLEKA